MTTTRDIYIDSTRRSNIYPSGNSYTIFIQNPLKNVTQVDLVSAVVPNTMYNITNSNIFNVTDFGGTLYKNVSIEPGFYSACSLVNAINNNQNTVVASLPEGEGKFVISNVYPFTNGFQITNVSNEFSNITKIQATLTTKLGGDGINLLYSNNYYVKSQSVLNMHPTGNFVFLEIDELRPPFPIDAVQDPLNSESFLKFATIPIDTVSGTMKTFKEMTDYKISVNYPTPIDKIDRLSIKWLDTNGNILNFNGVDQNSIILRFYTLDPIIIPEVEPTQQIIKKVFKNKSILFYFAVTFVLILIILFT